MKKTILFLSLFFLIFKTIESQTNVYHPFPDSNAVWNMHYYQYCFGPVTQENYSILMSGDTVISAQTYHKLSIPFVQVLTSTCGLNTTTGYKGAVRQDTALKKVFFVPPSSNTEELFYDFNLQVGDTVVGYFFNTFSTMPEIVQSIDSVLVGGNYHKRWQINPLYQVEFIEGIGSTYGLFVPLPGGNITEQPQRTITCFSKNDTTLYPPLVTSCNPFLSINDQETVLSRINFSPNPVSNQATLSTDINLTNAILVFYNSFGQQVQQINGISGETNTFLLENLPNGIYHVRLIQDGKLMAVDKLLKMD